MLCRDVESTYFIAEPPEVLFTEYEKGRVHEVSLKDTGNVDICTYVGMCVRTYVHTSVYYFSRAQWLW